MNRVLLSKLDYNYLIVDGKELRGTCPTGYKHALNQVVSVWVSEAQLTLAQRQIEAKENETLAIPQVLQVLNIADKVVTIDAIGCQHKLVEQITGQQGEYVLTLKANQEAVYEQVKTHFEKYSAQFKVGTQLSKDHHRGKN